MKLVSLDLETTGTPSEYALQPFRVRTDEARVTMWASAVSLDRVGGELIEEPGQHPLQHRAKVISTLKLFLDKCREQGRTICGWNVAFDMAWLIAYGLRDEVYACNWLDGMLLWKHLTASPEWTGIAPTSYGLKAAVAYELPEFAGYEVDVEFHDIFDVITLDKTFQYCKDDARFTVEIVQRFWDRLNSDQQRCAMIEAACLPMVAEAMVEGIHANQQAAEVLNQRLTDDANLNYVKLKLLSPDDNITPELLASPKQLNKLLFDKWGLPRVKLTPSGGGSTDRDALSQLAHMDERAELLNAYREAKNNSVKFAQGTINALIYNGDGRVRPIPRVYGTYTGRMTYSSKIQKVHPIGIALHQWKRDKEFRDIIEAPPGYTLLEFDFSGQEFRWMAELSGDTAMLQLCQPGEDAHGYMGGRVGGKDYKWMQVTLKDPTSTSYTEAKNLRQMGKVANLSCQYRTSANTLQRVARTGYQLKLTDAEATAIHGTYRVTYPAVQRYWKNQEKTGKLNGYVKTIAGRRVYVGCDWPTTQQWGRSSTTINFPIQGAGADQKYLALLAAKGYLPSVNGRFYFELHDGVFFIVPDEYAEKAAREMRELLSNLPYRQAWGVDLKVNFPVDAKTGKTWGGLKEFH